MFNRNGELNTDESVVHKLGLRQNVHNTILTTKAKERLPDYGWGGNSKYTNKTNPGNQTKDPIINYDFENKKQVESWKRI